MKWRFPDWLTESLDDPEMPLRLFLVFLLIFCPTHGRIVDLIKVEVVALAAIGVLVPWLVRRWEYWGLFTALFAVNLVYSFEHSANHYFLTLYTCMALAVMSYLRNRGDAVRINLPRALLIITFGFATLHKFLSEYFTSGRLLASYFLKGRTLQRPSNWFTKAFRRPSTPTGTNSTTSAGTHRWPQRAFRSPCQRRTSTPCARRSLSVLGSPS